MVGDGVAAFTPEGGKVAKMEGNLQELRACWIGEAVRRQWETRANW